MNPSMHFTHEPNLAYGSRRSVVIAPNAAVASSQPMATEAGLQVLRAGGSAADAAVAVAAALQVTQACSTGLGGDAFCLYYEAASDTVHAYNGSGRSPAALTMELALEAADAAEPPHATPTLPNYHAHTVTVPGAADAWDAVQARFGRLPMGEVLAPAIRLAEEGFSLGPMTSLWWGAGAERQLSLHRHGGELMIDGRGPRVGERFRNPGLARVLRAIAEEGREVLYRGWIAERIVAELAHEGGVMTMDDLAAHRGEWVDPISVEYGGYRVWECPPNGQGLAALLALNAYQHARERLGARAPGSVVGSPRAQAAAGTGGSKAESASGAAGMPSAHELHAQVEAMRLAFADAARFVADPAFAPAPIDELLGDEYARRRAAEIAPDRAMGTAGPGLPRESVGDDTVYFSVVDADGNGCSFINSNFMGFGTGIVPEGCGFSLQNRGRGFVLDPDHANALAPRKRPYHTIIPGLMTFASGGLAAVFGVMGGMMQPQGHLQVVAHLTDRGLDPQSALDAPRFQLADGDPDGVVLVEDSMEAALVTELANRGHSLTSVSGVRRGLFGLGQIIARGADGLWWAGSDSRGDGHAGGF